MDRSLGIHENVCLALFLNLWNCCPFYVSTAHHNAITRKIANIQPFHNDNYGYSVCISASTTCYKNDTYSQ